MNLKLNLTPEEKSKVKDILVAMASKNKTESWEAQEIFAAFVGPTIDQVLDQVTLSNQIFQTFTYDEGTNPSIPLDLFEGNGEGLITVWSESMPGGLASNLVSGMEEFRFTIDTLTSAVSCLTQYAKDARMDVVTLMIKRMVNEILLKSEYLNWSVVLGALANSRASAAGTVQIYDSAVADTFGLVDSNTLATKVKRLRTGWAGGTPLSAPGRGLTHLLISPEVEGQIRAISYQPQNTVVVPAAATTATAMPATDKVRNEVWKSGGIQEFFGIQLIVLNELGVGQVLNQVFDDAYSAGAGEPAFSASADEIVVGIDLSVPAFLKIVENGEGGGQTVVSSDDQFVKRQKKIGFYAERREGRIGLDSKSVIGLIV